LSESPKSIGDVLADYIDSGGSVIMASYSFSDPDIGIEGRLFDDKYSPFVKNGSADIEREYDRSSTHEIFENVARFATTIETDPVILDETATLIASNYDGVPFVAIKNRVIGMSAYPNPSYMDGDYSVLIANMISYLLTERVLLLYSDNPSPPQNISDLITPFGYGVDMMNITNTTPEIANISKYKVIVTWSKALTPADNKAWGNLTADYIDGGGSVIMFPYSYMIDPYGLGARFRTDEYSPFEYIESIGVSASYVGDSLHPIFNNVRGYDTPEALPIDITKRTLPLGYYDNGLIFAALKGSVIGINAYIPSSLSGDIAQLLINAIEFLINGVQYDVVQPSITNPSVNSMEEGTIGNSLLWRFFDPHPYRYELRVDGNVQMSGLWFDGDGISISTDGLSFGNHTYRVDAYDQVGNLASSTFIFSVVDTTIPVINDPLDVEIRFGDNSKNITWILSDNHPTNFVLYQNGTEILTDTWVTDQSVIITLTDLDLGLYIYLINASDSSGNFAIDSVSVSVRPLIVPSISSPADFYVVQGDAQRIIWYVEDDNPSIYTLSVDRVIQTNSSWVAMSTVEVNLGTYPSGYYNFTLTLYDFSGHEVSDTVMVQIFQRATETKATTSSSSPGFDIPTQFIAAGAIFAVGVGVFSLLFRRR
jgi:hypothetical protein